MEQKKTSNKHMLPPCLHSLRQQGIPHTSQRNSYQFLTRASPALWAPCDSMYLMYFGISLNSSHVGRNVWILSSLSDSIVKRCLEIEENSVNYVHSMLFCWRWWNLDGEVIIVCFWQGGIWELFVWKQLAWISQHWQHATIRAWRLKLRRID